MQHWDTLLPEALQRWQLQPNVLSAFSDGYRNGSLMKDRVGPSAPEPAASRQHIGQCEDGWACNPQVYSCATFSRQLTCK